MGTTTLVVSSESLTATALTHLNEPRDTRHRPYPITDAWLKSDKGFEGELMLAEFETSDHSVPTDLYSGYERYDDTFQPTLQPGTVLPAFTVQPALVSRIDQTKNSGSGKVLDITKRRVENTKNAMRRDIQKFLLRGAVGSGSWVGLSAYQDWHPLNGQDHATGFIEATTSGSNTLHGLAKGSFPAAIHIKLHNLFFDAANLAGTNLLNNMYQMGIQQRIRGGQPSPSEAGWFCSELAATHLKRALRPAERYMSQKEMDDGAAQALMYAGRPIIPTDDMPQDGANTAGNKWSVVHLDWRGLNARLYPGWKLDMMPFVDVPGSVGVSVAVFLLGGQTVCLEPGLQGLIVDAEGF